jgi:hypothetical protein
MTSPLTPSFASLEDRLRTVERENEGVEKVQISGETDSSLRSE